MRFLLFQTYNKHRAGMKYVYPCSLNTPDIIFFSLNLLLFFVFVLCNHLVKATNYLFQFTSDLLIVVSLIYEVCNLVFHFFFFFYETITTFQISLCKYEM